MSLGKDYKAACDKLRALRGTRVIAIPGNLTVGQAAEKWVESYLRTTRTPGGQGLAAARVEQFLKPFAGRMRLSRLTRENIREYRVWLESRGKRKPISLMTVKHILSDLRCMLNWCEDAGYLERSPFPRRVMPKLQERPPDRLANEEVELLVQLPDPYGFVSRLGLGTGLRWGELLRLQSTDLVNGALLIHQTKSRRVRRVPISAQLAREIQEKVGLLMPFKSSCSFAVQVRKRTGIARFHAHQMRHTFACRWLEAGGSLATLQELLGHSSVVMTQRYARLSDGFVRQEAARIYAEAVS